MLGLHVAELAKGAVGYFELVIEPGIGVLLIAQHQVVLHLLSGGFLAKNPADLIRRGVADEGVAGADVEIDVRQRLDAEIVAWRRPARPGRRA